jgi:hypothetical protein
MGWLTSLSGLAGLKSLMAQIRSRLFPEDVTQVVGEVFDTATISVVPIFRFKLCQFTKCTFVWDDDATDDQEKIFLSCNFDDCDFGVPLEEFISYTFGSTIDRQYMPRLTPQQALEEAVRRVHQRQPVLAQQCLDPSSQVEREHVAQWVKAEYRKILMDA